MRFIISVAGRRGRWRTDCPVSFFRLRVFRPAPAVRAEAPDPHYIPGGRGMCRCPRSKRRMRFCAAAHRKEATLM